MASIIDRRHSEAPPDGTKSLDKIKDHFRKTHPNIFELLSTDVHNGHPRQRATCSIFVEEGKYKVCVSDRETGEMTFQEALGLAEAMLAMETALEDGSASWRLSNGRKNGYTPKPSH